ncbi:PD40 domain-containing protein [bacterium]|nr:PD40 domain-containing protein [bacterium]
MIRYLRVIPFVFALAAFLISSCASNKIVDPSRRRDVPADKKLCVFRSDIDEEYNFEIYLLRADKGPIGEKAELVLKLSDTPSPAAEVFPTITRDCNTVVYCSSVNDMGTNPFFPDFDLFKVQVDTGETTMITDTGQDCEYAPSISADGSILTFMVREFMGSSADLYMMKMDNPDERILIQERLSQKSYPRITADGEMVLYSAPTGKTKKMDVFLVNLATREVKNMTRTPDLEEYYPDISDDRQIIVYQLNEPYDDVVEEEEEEASVPVSANDGGKLEDSAGDGNAADSVDGSEPIDGADDIEDAGVEENEEEVKEPEASEPETTKRKGNWEIYVFNMANGQKMKVTDNDYHDLYPVISGDGTWVIYTSAREDMSGDGQEESMIYMMDLLTMKEELISAMPFHHDTIEISW